MTRTYRNNAGKIDPLNHIDFQIDFRHYIDTMIANAHRPSRVAVVESRLIEDYGREKFDAALAEYYDQQRAAAAAFRNHGAR
jgi:hypothetical protein